MSRVHQGQSPSYERKILVREARTFDRLMFKLAKIFHDRVYNIENSNSNDCMSINLSITADNIKQNGVIDNSYLDRAFIRRWKTKIYRFLEKDQNVT